MITTERRGSYNGVWVLVGPGGRVNDRIWFDEARAVKAAQRERNKRKQTTLDL